MLKIKKLKIKKIYLKENLSAYEIINYMQCCSVLTTSLYKVNTQTVQVKETFFF